jgi:3-oxoacyl-[acyl-carrier-protein] synthase II
MDRKVVVTGMGALTPLGLGVAPTWEGMRAGRSGIRKISLFDASGFDSQIAGEVAGFDPQAWMEPREARHADRFTQLAVAAAKMAVADAGLDMGCSDPTRVGVLIGSGIGGTGTWEAQHRILLEKGPGRISAFFIPMLIMDMASGKVAMELGARGPNFGIASACATSAHAIGEAAKIIARGDAEAMIAGGSEAAVSPLAVGGFCAMRALSRRNDAPEQASRPFDRDRDGFVMAEGAGVVILEEWEHARHRGARVHGHLLGYGATADAYHMTSPCPDGDGMARSMEAALRDAGLSADQVDYVNTHGTATQTGDPAETLALKRVFGDRAHRVPCSSTKSVTGHLLGAAGAVELIACLMAIADGVAPPTINLDHPDPECDLDYVPKAARDMPIKIAMTNSFGFGGHNATLIVGHG